MAYYQCSPNRASQIVLGCISTYGIGSLLIWKGTTNAEGINERKTQVCSHPDLIREDLNISARQC